MHIGDYAIIEEIGRGDTGIVYQAERAGQSYSLKMAMDDAPFRQAQMKQEAKVLSWLKHPAVPKLYDYFEHEGKACVLLDYIKGRDFDTVLQECREPFSEAQVLRWGLRLAEVLQQIHDAQHIYAYLAPSHIILNEAGEIFLIDFGKTLPYYPDAQYPPIGLAGYSPPEQYIGKQEPRSDVYSLAVFMYQLASLRDPRHSHAAFLFHVLPPRSLNPKLSSGFEALLLKALEHKAIDRFESIAALKEAIMDCAI